MHEYMTLHAHSNPLPSHSRPRDAKISVGAVGECYDKAKHGNCPGAATLFSVREIIGNFKKMLKPWGGQEKYPFFLKMRQWGPP